MPVLQLRLQESTPAVARRNRLVVPAGALAVYAALIVAAHLWGEVLRASGVRIGLDAAPLFGEVMPRLSLRIVPAIVLAAVLVSYGEQIAERLPWKALLVGSFAGAGAWAIALAASDGWAALKAPLLGPFDAYAALRKIGSAGELLKTFTHRIQSYPIHVQSHPPGLPLLLSMLRGVGLARPGVIAALYIVAGAAIVPAVLVTARALSGEGLARRAAPWLVLAPYAIWIATSADALYAGVAAWSIALLLSAGPKARVRPVAGGLLFGGALFLTYGVTLLAIVPAGVTLMRRRFQSLAWWGAGVLTVVAAFRLAGFWWFDGLAATRIGYYAGLGGERPYRYFLLADLAALAIACGPAALRGVAEIRNRLGDPAAPVVIGALIAVAAADLSGLSKGEVERIWLPLAPWILLAAAFLNKQHRTKVWLAAGAASAILVQVLVMTPW